MKSNVIKFRSKNPAEDPDQILEKAKGTYQDVILLGWNTESRMNVRASYGMSIEEMIYLVDQFKHNLLSGKYYE